MKTSLSDYHSKASSRRLVFLENKEFPYDSNFYVDVLLAHEKVYTFARSLMFDSLEELALQ
jgi:hypothetical protein